MRNSVSRYAVLGSPVAHSKSPRIHAAFAAETNQQLDYTAVEVTGENFNAFAEDFFAKGGAGLNITVPHKEKAFKISNSCSERAMLAKAVNTLLLDKDKRIYGDNTDGIGLLRDLQNNHELSINNKNILILGAGGAVRGVLATLALEDVSSITIANRTIAKAELLCKEFSAYAEVLATGYDELGLTKFDLIINGTSMGLSGETPALSQSVLADQCCCYDMMYGNEETAFVKWAKNNGANQAVDGLGMLVEQAAEAFYLWREVRPDTAAVIAELRTLG